MVDVTTIGEQLGYQRILNLGDAMLDRYTWGNAERVSPEAPVLVLRADQREVRLGGAASVAVLLRALEAEVTLATVLGDDHDGRTIRRLLNEAGIGASAILTDATRPTTTKERFLGHSVHRQPHQILRIDTESREPLDNDLTEQLLQSLAELIPQHAAVLISDYAKGVCTPQLVAEVISQCRKSGIPVLVDPGRGVDLGIYRGATLVKPNRLEAELAIGQKIVTPAEGLDAAKRLRAAHGIESVIITLDRDGLVLASEFSLEHLPITPRALTDITGAGDTALATLGLGFASGLELEPAARLANVAAGLQIQLPGVTPIPRTDLLREWQSQSRDSVVRMARPPASISKFVSLESAQYHADEYRQGGRKIVFTNGCFDLLHIGHVTMLEECARHGDVLIVAINSDTSVRRLKGNERPIIGEQDRAKMLAALACVSHVLIFDDDTPHRVLKMIRPDVLVKRGTTGHIVGHEIVEQYGGQVERTGEVPGFSTTALVDQINSSQPGIFRQEIY
jgi:D-beta-D-heptose 7-phosphate kinase/D-beta-D-heptose 1-phosphate adenosyltransferase